MYTYVQTLTNNICIFKGFAHNFMIQFGIKAD